MLLGRCFRGFVLPVLEYCSTVWCSAADTHLKLLGRVVSGARLEVCLSVTLHIVGLWQYYVCCTRSGVIRCTLFTVLYLDRMCRCKLHASHIGTLIRLLAAEPRRTAGFLLQCQCVCGTILVNPIRWCGTGGFQEQGQCLFIGLAARSLLSPAVFPFSSSFHGLVLWGWGLILPALHCQPFAIIIITANRYFTNFNCRL